MLRRLSTTFKKDRKKDGAGPNGSSPKSSAGASPTHGHSELKPDTSTDREDMKGTFSQFAQVLHAARRPLPTQTGDGSYVKREDPASLFDNLKTFGIGDAKTLKDVLQNKAKKELIDDKTYLMERVIQLVADLPGNSALRADLTNTFVDELWDCLQHPPVSYVLLWLLAPAKQLTCVRYLGDQYSYRQADGSYNNIMYPHLGAVLPGALPDPGLVFDAVFSREEFKEHPNKVSSVIFYWASLIIHDLFQTDHRDMNVSKTSSYLDLAPLYGDNQEDQNWIRTFKEGKLKADCFSESRMLGFPPGCGVLLVMFNRFHNFIVEELAKINEGGRFTKPHPSLPPDMAKEAWAKYDNDLFQTGRLVTCGLYINITLGDYLRTIVNLNRSNTTWTLDPRVDMAKVFGTDGTPRGVGNQVSAEFNLVYRWHSATSKRDEKWTEDMYQSMFGKPAAEVPMDELLRGLAKWDKTLDKDPQKRPFAGLQRDSKGKYSDDELVKILTESIEDCAGAFGANNVPKALRAVEILGMHQARKWGLATLNEFRKFFGLKPHDTFESINSDPKVAEQLRHLYDHPDYVELYPGLVTEEAKEPMVPGVGIAPTFTISKAILSDAVVLVRGDRFYTVDYHPRNLTNWGFNEVQYDLNVEQGCVFYKLFLRAFPAHFKPNSIYAHYPMTIPSENRKIMRNLGRESHYSWDRPGLIPPRINITTYVGAKAVLEQQRDFKVTWGVTLEELMGKGGSHFMLSGDEQLHANQRKTMAKSLYRENWQRDVKTFYEHITLKLLHEKSFKIAGINHVDLTRDVGNLSHVHFASNMFSLPLKTKENPRGILTEHEMYMALAVIFCCIFFDLEPAKSFPLHRAAYAVSNGLGKLIEANVKAASSTSWISGITDSFRENSNYLKEYGVHMFTQIMDFYLSPRGTPHLPEIRRLAWLDTPAAEETLMHYAMEAIRLNGTFGSYREAASSTTILDGRGDDAKRISVKPGDKVFVSFVGAAKDPVVFPDPEEVRLDRPLESYIHYGEGPHTCLGRDASRVALTAMLKTVGKLERLRRAPGPKGELKKIPREGGFYVYMREDHGSYFPFPLTMQVCWDGDLPPLE
ncbi:putative fatty acid oxygenase [Diplodia seriata]|uniref:Putative fatty acid oxygenase n=1 Tax=Diplodia seriata TaxID=420778 RepID=A0A0G2E0U8_9PEZI|nr:putative fatty acid oxygenase [Diplodia seriata]